MNKQRLYILIAAILGAFGTFLPWVNTFIGSVSGTVGDGWLTLILFAVVIVLCLVKDKDKRLEGRALYGAIASSVLAAVIGLYAITNINAAAFGVASVGFGLYLVVLAAIAVPALGFLIKD